ncbi:hypothetical protein IQ219_14980, partial [Synechocystis sp. LEGE 06083]|uniref:beta strand repeat-containing protein n=1 Tax=Synechocystis sp. LEGE 06083 TaxID=915336 RepID=UPI001A0F4F95
MTGGAGNDLLIGGLGNDTLNGGGGINTLVGGTGNDIYVVDSTTDTITENSGEGTDTVISSVSFDLGTSANVENLTLTGKGDINGTGNGLDNVILGNTGNNSLNGGAGSDTITGGGGNDTIDGGDQADTLKYSGDRSDYTITLSGSTYTIVDERGGSPDGTDTITNVENFQFADGPFTAVNLIETTAPSVTDVTSLTPNGIYNAGDVISIQVAFSEVVNVTGTPQLTLETGTTDRTIDYLTGSGTNTLKFSYIVQTGDTSTDLDYINALALSLNSGTIRDSSNNDAVLTLSAPGTTNSLGSNKNLVIDTTAPIVVSINDGDADNVVTVGDTLTYTVTFSEDINASTVSGTDFNNAGTAIIEIGTITETSAGVFTVQVTPTSTGTIALRIPSGAVIEDVAGNTLTVPVQDNDTVTVNAVPDTTAPIVVSINDGDADNIVTVGDTLTYTVTFSEDINASTVSATDFNNAGTAIIEIGTITETSAGVFTVQVTPSTTGTIALRIPSGAVIEDVAGNALTVPVQDNDTVTVNAVPDTTAPILININDGDADNLVTVGDTLTYTVTFSEDINASTVSGTDFNNAGTAIIEIGTITETSAGVFTVQVTPT